MTKDYYAQLGVSRDASADDIRRSYRKLARKWHPDVNPGDATAEETFKGIAVAYDVLSDPDKRKLYDEFGEDGLRGGFDPDKARAYRRWSDARDVSGGDGEGGIPFEFDLRDVFGDLLGGGVPGAGRRRPTAPARGADVLAEVELDFVQALRGAEVSLRVPGSTACTACGGSGDRPGTVPETCGECSGSGHRQAVQGPMRIMTACRACAGTGRRRSPCPSCAGAGAVPQERTVVVRIPAGADTGDELRVAGRGQHLPGTTPGDLVVRTRVRPHPVFSRRGLDLHATIPVTLREAYAGAKIEVPTPTGTVTLTVPPRSQSGSKLRLRGRGVERGKTKGDLLVELSVRLPEVDDAALAEALARADELYGKPVREEVRL